MPTFESTKTEKIISASAAIVMKRQEREKIDGEIGGLMAEIRRLTGASKVTVTASSPREKDGKKRPESQKLILKALTAAGGPVGVGDIIAKGKLSPNAVHVAMSRLVEEGVVKKVKYGTYELKA